MSSRKVNSGTGKPLRLSFSPMAASCSWAMRVVSTFWRVMTPDGGRSRKARDWVEAMLSTKCEKNESDAEGEARRCFEDGGE